METRVCDFVFRACPATSRLVVFALLYVWLGFSNPAHAWTQIAAGGMHTCGISEDATVHCWGEGRYGQLGDGAEHARARPVQIPMLKNVVELALGESHSCARTSDGNVYCFGRNHRGQLGDGSARDQSLPVRVAWLKDAVGLAAGANHNCALRKAGDVLCWGDNRYRQLATPSRLPFHRRPVALQRLRNVIQVQAGLAHTCFLKQNGRVFCAGGNFAGQLAATSRFPSARALQIGDLSNLVEIGAGLLHTCARNVQGDVHCWGGHFQTANQPQRQPELSPASALVVGGEMSCGVREIQQELRCIGRDLRPVSRSLLLSTTKVPTSTAALPTETAGAVISPPSLKAGTHHLCGLAAGSAHCLGDNSAGQLADGTRGGLGTASPLYVRNTDTSASLFARDGRFCTHAQKDDSCWGIGRQAPLPEPFCRRDSGSRIECRLRNGWQGVTDGTKVRQAVGGDRFGCWLDTPGNVYCLGESMQGELGNGELQASSPLPLWVPGLKQVTQIVAGRDFVCALEVLGHVKCWGSGLLGQLGTGRYRSSPEPVDVAGLRDVEEISAGRAHVCARGQNGDVHCWGNLFSGPEATPRLMDMNARVIQLVSSDASTCARSADDRVFCWGRGSRGELGQTKPMHHEHWTKVIGPYSP